MRDLFNNPEPVELICTRCREKVKLSNWGSWSGICMDWKDAETIAGIRLNTEPHKCTPTSIELGNISTRMKNYRAEHPGITFEEECKYYNLLLSNQTYFNQ